MRMYIVYEALLRIVDIVQYPSVYIHHPVIASSNGNIQDTATGSNCNGMDAPFL